MAEENKNRRDIAEKELENSSLEEMFVSLEEVIQKLEKEEITLEESFSLYQQGMGLLKMCNGKIDAVEKKVLILDEYGESHEF